MVRPMWRSTYAAWVYRCILPVSWAKMMRALSWRNACVRLGWSVNCSMRRRFQPSTKLRVITSPAVDTAGL